MNPGKHYHPRRNDAGDRVEIRYPSQPTDLAAWAEPTALASVVPDGAMPMSVAGIAIESWITAPREDGGWEALAASMTFDEPPFETWGDSHPASGAVLLEPDGRVWVVSPTNRFGGYRNTFPKGKLDGGQKISMRANALKEVFEESGLRAELGAFLVDARRSSSTTRYYLGRRIGGNPADMGWESQAVHLVPPSQLAKFVAHGNDKPILQALAARLALAFS